MPLTLSLKSLFFEEPNKSNISCFYPKSSVTIAFFKKWVFHLFLWRIWRFNLVLNSNLTFPQTTVGEVKKIWPVIGSCTCQTDVGGVSGVTRVRERSCQTPTIVWNIIRAVEKKPKHRSLRFCGIQERQKQTSRERTLNYSIVANWKTSFFVYESLLRAWLEFCWQTSQPLS